MKTKTLEKIKGDLITVDIEVESLNEQYAKDFDGYLLTPQTSRNKTSTLYGFYGIPLDETEAHKVQVYYR